MQLQRGRVFIRAFRPAHGGLVLVGVAALLSSLSLAQSVPDAGSLLQQIEQERELALPSAVPLEQVTQPPPELKPRPKLPFYVKEFRFVGNTLLTDEQLALAVAGFLNRTLSFEDLQRAEDALAARYREAGWIVRGYLPEQDISEGVVTLHVVAALKFDLDNQFSA
ncbi:POTRA domain-containing protein [Rhodocyclus purpureus]|uniref:POTRA domain-containing protein n=1 Tax=Rhodocyclus purpureus TaxID=1067 RepID=UPI001911898F